MARQALNYGTAPGDGTGEFIFYSFQKCEANFIELYSLTAANAAAAAAAQSTANAKVDTVNGQTGTVVLAKADVGLGNADNTADADKPVSTLQQTALDAKADKLFADSEYDSTGLLVFPCQYGVSVTYNADGTINTVTATDTISTWVMTFAYSGKNIDTLTVVEGANTWINTFVYNADGTISSVTGWVKQP